MPPLLYKTPPYDYQRQIVEDAHTKSYGALFLEQGLGKSKIMIDILANTVIRGVLLVAPGGLHKNWANHELPKHGDVNVCVWHPGLTKQFRQEFNDLCSSPAEKQAWFLMNIEALRTLKGSQHASQFLNAQPSTAFVIDESTCIKNPKSQITKAAMLLAPKATTRWCLTGTPMAQQSFDIWSQAKFLHPDTFPQRTLFAFQQEYCQMKHISTNSGRGFWKVIGEKNQEELNSRITPWSYTRKKDTHLTLPEKSFSRVHVPLTEEQQRHYQEIKTQAFTMLDTGELKTVNDVLTQLSALVSITCGHLTVTETSEDPLEGIIDSSPKAIPIPHNRTTVLKEHLDLTRKTLIFCHTYAHLKDLQEALEDHQPCVYAGNMSFDARAASAHAFQTRDTTIMLATYAAAKGLTLTACNTIIYYSRNYSIESRLQSQDRIHRIGQTQDCHYIDLVSEKTVESKMLDHISTKQKTHQTHQALLEILTS